MKLDSRKELTPVIYSDMPVKTANFFVSENTSCFKEHWHERMELLHIEEGKMTVTVGGETFEAQNGDTVIVCPEAVHIGNTADSKVKYKVLMFDTAAFVNSTFAAKRLLEGLIKGAKTVKPLVRDDDVTELLQKIFIIAEKKTEEAAVFIEGCIYMLLSILLERHVATDTVQLPQKRFDRVFDYIAQNLDRDLSTQNLCRLFGYDKSYFCRRFKADSGLSPSGYVRIIRLEKSKRLLSEGISVGNASVLCGFSSYGYFARCFKAEYKMSPSEYVKLTVK